MKDSFDEWILANTDLTYLDWLAYIKAKERSDKIRAEWNTLYSPGLFKDFAELRTGVNDTQLGKTWDEL